MKPLYAFLFFSGLASFLVGAVVRFLLAPVAVAKNAGGLPSMALADLYPKVPTWWVAESGAGFACAVALAGLGVWLLFKD